jgi:hypothetical protein
VVAVEVSDLAVVDGETVQKACVGQQVLEIPPYALSFPSAHASE